MLRLVTILLLFSSMTLAQTSHKYHLPAGVKGKGWILESSHSMFPDSLRTAIPRIYDGKTYSTAAHYNDSSVLVFVPDYFDRHQPLELVMWFHGWFNNIDSAVSSFRLLEQFYTAGRNAVFIFPEGPKNAPDSYGGKLEIAIDPLLIDVQQLLRKNSVLPKKETNRLKLVLAGHSGAYRVMAHIDSLAQNIVTENIMFDALYGQHSKYLQWIKSDEANRFINIYTDNGGTRENSIDFMKTLDAFGILYLHKEEDDLTDHDLKTNRIIFLHSKMGHNEVINHQNNFERFLRR